MCNIYITPSLSRARALFLHNNLEVVGVTTVGSGVTISVAGIKATSGIITAKEFDGDGSALTGLPAGFTELDAALFN